MLNRLTPLAHFFRMLVEPPLNGFEDILMLPTCDPALLAGGAAGRFLEPRRAEICFCRGAKLARLSGTTLPKAGANLDLA